MPNVTWQEPQILADLLAMNIYASANSLFCPPPKQISIISPWLSNIEILLRPGPWYQKLRIGNSDDNPDLLHCVNTFVSAGWQVQLCVLRYGGNQPISKPPTNFALERQWLAQALSKGAEVYLSPNLHAKGLVTPLGIVTGSTNITHSGLYLQSQNANFFPHGHSDYVANRLQLLSNIRDEDRVASIP